MATPRCEPSWSSIPDDIALKIAYFLEAADVCSLGSCSRFWLVLCDSDCLWMELANKRWPAAEFGSTLSGSSQLPSVSCSLDEVIAQEASVDSRTAFPLVQGWKKVYIYKHRSLVRAVSVVKEFVELCTENESLEAGVLLNLIGLHYCLVQLKITPGEAIEALRLSQVSEREICVRWFRLGRWFYGFRLQDEHHSRKISLGELAMGKDDEILGVLNRGAVHEVIRVHITQVNPETTASNSVAG